MWEGVRPRSAAKQKMTTKCPFTVRRSKKHEISANVLHFQFDLPMAKVPFSLKGNILCFKNPNHELWITFQITLKHLKKKKQKYCWKTRDKYNMLLEHVQFKNAYYK